MRMQVASHIAARGVWDCPVLHACYGPICMRMHYKGCFACIPSTPALQPGRGIFLEPLLTLKFFLNRYFFLIIKHSW